MHRDRMSPFLRAYLECALWITHDERDDAPTECLDGSFEVEDFTDEAFARAFKDCDEFAKKYGHLIRGDTPRLRDVDDRWSQAGHDFWLTRNGHGSGFWDGDWPANRDALTKAATEFGEVHCYVTYDGKVGME